MNCHQSFEKCSILTPDMVRRKQPQTSLESRNELVQDLLYSRKVSNAQYAVKAQTSLAPLSRFRGSRVTTAHAHQCCIFQSYAKTVPSTYEIDDAWTSIHGINMTTDHVIRACDVLTLKDYILEKFHKLHDTLYIKPNHVALKAPELYGFVVQTRITILCENHAHQCCIFQSYAKTQPSQQPHEIDAVNQHVMGCITTDHVIRASWRLTLTAYSYDRLRFVHFVEAPVFGTLMWVLISNLFKCNLSWIVMEVL